MRIFGVYMGGHDFNVACVDNGRVVAAVEEERLSRHKHHGQQHGKAPRLGMDWLAEQGAAADIIALATPIPHGGEGGLMRTVMDVMGAPHEVVAKSSTYEHHRCHLATAWLWSGWDNCYAMAVDGGGSAFYGAVAHCSRRDGIELLAFDKMEHRDNFIRPGSLYLQATAALGFTPIKDEGKVMCLAARGDPARYWDALWKGHTFVPFGAEGPDIVWPDWHGDPYARADLAAAVQAGFERIIGTTLRAHVPMNARVALAGGSFANVLINRQILEWAAEVFVAPPMNDGGLAAGAALLASFEAGEAVPHRVSDMYLGPDAGPWPQDVDPAQIAAAVENGALVAICVGRCEYGPRALGNRTVLADPRRADTPERLNAALRRDGFMPFAPVMTEMGAAVLLEPSWRRAAHAAQFMTMAFRVASPEQEHRIPAATHFGTCRPQIVKHETNPAYHDVVQAFGEMTGLPVLINTSFNLHGEPIVGTEEHALRSFAASGLDMLVTTSGLRTK